MPFARHKVNRRSARLLWHRADPTWGKPMPRRLIPILLLILALTPGLWLRAPRERLDFTQMMTAQALPLPPDCCRVGPLRVTGAWHLTSPNQQFLGYSALVAPEPGRLLAISDAAYTMDFPQPGLAGPVHLGSLLGSRPWRKKDRDTEAAQWDPRSQRLWVAAEGQNAIYRFDRDLRVEARVRPQAMQRWPDNTGPESLARLADGRFVTLCECAAATRRGWAHPALLFRQDPIRAGEPIRFFAEGPQGWRPTDMTQLPDGRILVLQRQLRWPFPPRFGARLALLDPAGIAPGAVLPMTDLGELLPPVPMDNYEGLAWTPLGPGRIAVWIISDDNRAALQRTLLLKLELNLQDLPQR